MIKHNTFKDFSGGLSVRQLRDRLSVVIRRNEESGRELRSDLPIVLVITPPKTPTGRLRRRIRVPVRSVHSAMVSRMGDSADSGWVEMFSPVMEGGPLQLRRPEATTIRVKL